MIHLTLEHGYHPLTMFTVLVVALGLTLLFYRRVFGELSRRRRRVLLGLRFAALVVVTLLLFRPVVSLERWVTERRTLVFLVDTSSSMSVADDATGVPRFEQARRRVISWWGRLEDEFELRLVEFSATAHSVKGPESLVQEPRGQATSLAQALLAGNRQAPQERLEALVLISDGVDNSAGSPQGVAERLGTPVYAVGTGSSLRNSVTFRDIRITDLECAEQLTKDNRARITAQIDGIGLPGHVVQVSLEEDGRAVATASLTLDDQQGPAPVVLEFTPTTKGVHTYSVHVPVVKGEKISQNNRRTTTALVVDARIRVLYLEGTLRPEYGAITGMFLAKDPNIEFCSLVQTRPGVFTQRTNIEGMVLRGIPSDAETFTKFDVFLVGDLDSSFLSPEQMQQIRERVSAGAGLLMMGGYHSLGPGGYAGTPIEEILPVFVGGRDIGQNTLAFVPRLTAEGVTHPIFANITSFFPRHAGDAAEHPLPPLRGCVRVDRAKPGATVLAVYSAEDTQASTPMPVLAVQPFGKGRTAVFTGDTTRSWQQGLRAADQESPFLRFWGQTVRWLAGRTAPIEAAASLTANTDKRYYEPGAAIVISALVRNEQGEGSNQADVSAKVALSKARTKRVNLTLIPGPAGHYQYRFDSLPPGRHEIRVSAQLDGESLKVEPITIEVGRPNLEFDRLDLDDEMLTGIAAASGGRYSHIRTADRLIEALSRKRHSRQVQLELPLFSPILFWLLFVTVVTCEWILRRRYQLR